MQADRARGFTLRQVAQLHGVSKTYAHWATRHVPVELVHRKWHLARWRKPDAPPLTQRLVHEIRGGIGRWER